jgi:hypothetical protein
VVDVVDVVEKLEGLCVVGVGQWQVLAMGPSGQMHCQLQMKLVFFK